MEGGVSVIICCYNSNKRLPSTLSHLANQEVKDLFPWEIILVNNNSSDDTALTAETEWRKLNLNIPFKVVHEVTPGLSFARQKGLNEVQFEYVIFCDDDNWLGKDYVNKAFELMNNNPKIGVIGGRCEAVSNGALPMWFSTYQTDYAVGVQALDSGSVAIRGYVWGAGMIIRKSVLDKLSCSGFAHLLSGRSGDLLTSGEDAEICKWFLIAGYQVWYHEELFFRHFIPDTRLNKDYLKNLHQGFKLSSSVLNTYDFFISQVLHEKKNNFRIFFTTIFHCLKYVFFKHSFSKMYIAFKCPIAIARLLDTKCYSIRISSKKYFEFYQLPHISKRLKINGDKTQ